MRWAFLLTGRGSNQNTYLCPISSTSSKASRMAATTSVLPTAYMIVSKDITRAAQNTPKPKALGNWSTMRNSPTDLLPQKENTKLSGTRGLHSSRSCLERPAYECGKVASFPPRGGIVPASNYQSLLRIIGATGFFC